MNKPLKLRHTFASVLILTLVLLFLICFSLWLTGAFGWRWTFVLAVLLWFPISIGLTKLIAYKQESQNVLRRLARNQERVSARLTNIEANIANLPEARDSGNELAESINEELLSLQKERQSLEKEREEIANHIRARSSVPVRLVVGWGMLSVTIAIVLLAAGSLAYGALGGDYTIPDGKSKKQLKLLESLPKELATIAAQAGLSAPIHTEQQLELLRKQLELLENLPRELAILSAQAGLAAYIDTEQRIDLNQLKDFYSGVKERNTDFISGKISLPADLKVGWGDKYFGFLALESVRDVHVYVHRQGWIVAYYPKEYPVTNNIIPINYGFSLSWDVLEPLRLGLDRVLGSGGLNTGIRLAQSDIKYFDFSQLDSNALSLVVARASAHASSTFSFLIPEDAHVVSASWYHSTHNVDSSLFIDGRQVSNAQGVGSVPSSVQYERGIHRGALDCEGLQPGLHQFALSFSNTYYDGTVYVVLALVHRSQGQGISSNATVHTFSLEFPTRSSVDRPKD